MSIVLEQTIVQTVRALKACKMVLFPTDTMWSLSCSMNCEKTISRICNLKKLDRNNPLILLVCDEFMLKRYIKKLHPRVETVLHYYQRPLTLVHKNPINIPKHILASDGTMAIRIVKNHFCQAVIHDLDNPIVISSANISSVDPMSFSEIPESVKSEIDFMVPKFCYDPVERKPSKIASYNSKGVLEFIRS